MYSRESSILAIALLGIAVTLAGCAAPSASPTPAPSAPSLQASVSIKDFAFNPPEISVARGGTVTWINQENAVHTIRFSDGQSPELSNGSTYTKTFVETGRFEYTCGIHPSMRGVVVVKQ